MYSNKISTAIICNINPSRSTAFQMLKKLMRKCAFNKLFVLDSDVNCPKKIQVIVRRSRRVNRMKSKNNYHKHKEYAREIIVKTVDNIAQKHGFSYNRIAIKNQKTRLGSCSTKKNLNFNWQIIKFPKPIMEYVIKHELAHLNEPNHSDRYWFEVQKIDRAYKRHHAWIKENAYKYID